MGSGICYIPDHPSLAIFINKVWYPYNSFVEGERKIRYQEYKQIYQRFGSLQSFIVKHNPWSHNSMELMDSQIQRETI